MTLTFHRMIDFRYNDFEMAKSCYRNRAFVDFVWLVITLFTSMSLFVSLSHSHSGLLLVLIHIYLQRSLLNCHKNLIEDKAQRGDNSKSFCRLKCIIACKYTWAALQKSATFLLSFLLYSCTLPGDPLMLVANLSSFPSLPSEPDPET